jgi:serine/threonine-protein phosphatase PP1 catalytic subunit
MGNSISKKSKGNSKHKRLSTSSSSNKKPFSKSQQQQSSPVQPRLDITNAPDNENSVNTTQSISSILITSSQHRKNNPNNNNNASALSQLNPDYPTGNGKTANRNLNDSNGEYNEQDTIGPGPDPFMGIVEHPQQHKLLAQSDFWPPKKASGQTLDVNDNTVDSSQLTVSSMNQLTMNSVSSMNMQNAPAQIDDYIRRLLDAGYASKVPKQLCLKYSEVNAICRAAMEIFLSQPVSSYKEKKGKKRQFSEVTEKEK